MRKNPYEGNEKEIMDLLSKSYNLFIETPQTHPSDMDDFCKAIHLAQGIIMERIVRRDYPNVFKSIPENNE